MLQLSSSDPVYSPSDSVCSHICEVPKEIRDRLYTTHLYLPSLGRMRCVSKQFKNEITDLIFTPSNAANKLSFHVSRLDELLEFTKICGKQIKYLKLSLEIERNDRPFFEEMTETESPNALAATQKVIKILRNCPNLALFSLEYEIDGMDNNKLFDEVNDNILPDLSLLEGLSFKDAIFIGLPVTREFKKVERLNIDSLSRLHKLSLENFDFNKEVLAQIKKLPESIDIQLNLSCRGPIPEYVIEEFKNCKPNYKIIWDLTSANISFPEANLRALQEIGCYQEASMSVGYPQPTDEEITLLKVFKRVIVEDLKAGGNLKERVEAILPGQNVIFPTVTLVNANPVFKVEQDCVEQSVNDV